MNLGRSFDGFLLDMNGTFMFGQDRFGPIQDYHDTYRHLGGTALAGAEVRDALTNAFTFLAARYEDPAYEDAFPTLREAFDHDRAVRSLPADEITLLMRVVAEHECGRVPPEYAAWLSRAAQTHWLGLITNIWSPKDRWLQQFERDGIASVFTATVWSSDGRSIKPSTTLFEQILAMSPGARTKIAMIGDSPQRDVAGAHRVGLPSILVGDHNGPGDIQPTFSCPSLLDIEM